MTPRRLLLALCFILSSPVFTGCFIKDKIVSPTEKPSKTVQTPVSSATSEEGKIVSMESEIVPGQVNIVLRSDKKIHYSAYKLFDPERLVVELENTHPGDYQDPLIVDQGAVRKVTPMFFPESKSTRIEVALDNPTEFNIEKRDENSIAIEIKTPPKNETAGGHKEVSAEKIIVAKVESQPVVAAQEEKTPVIPVPESPQIMAGEVDGMKKEDFIFSETGPKSYAGQRVSMDFQNADVKNILRLLAEVSGLNVITTPEVQGTVTLRLMNVPWDQALDIVLKNNNLGMAREENIIRVATKAQIDLEKQSRLDERKKLIEEKAAKVQAEPLYTETVKINYAEIDKLAANLEGLKSERGKITMDQRTFTMILVDAKDNLKKMQDLIHVLDTPPKQVSIEARIVEVSRNYTKGLGIQWGGSVGATTGYGFPNTIGVGGGGASTPSGAGNYVVDLPAAVSQGAGAAIGMMFSNLSGTQFLDVQLSAMEKAGKAKILSNPRVTTKDNVEAVIESGKDIPFETTTANAGTTTEWKKATIRLATTPHITPDGYISLKINAAKDEPDTGLTSKTGTPAITTRNVNTEVLVKNGETLILGGLFKNNEGQSHGGVPWLSDIPGLGWLFKNKASTNDEEELMIFITPKIIERTLPKG
jgi:type IV pilus assembly protein PilQ